LVDASVSFLFNFGSSAKAHVTLFGRNLLDDRGTVASFTVGAFPTLWPFATAYEPRTYGVTLGVEF
jgi:iron complex outermembrane recepter protein